MSYAERILVGKSGVAVNEYGEEGAVVSSVETTIVSYVVPASTTFNIQGCVVSSGPAAKYRLKVDGVTKASIRTTATKPSELVNFREGFVVASTGETVTITGLHGSGSNQEMNASVFGFIE